MHTPPTSDTLYRAFFEDNPAIKLLIDPDDGCIVDANPAACRFYGYSREQMRTLRITDINQLPPGTVRRRMLDAEDRYQTTFIFPHQLASGEVRSVEVHSGPVPIDGKTYLFSIVHDVTERLQVRKELERFYDISPEPMCVVRADGRLERCNAAFANLLGYTAEQLTNHVVLDYVHPDDRAATQAEMDRRRKSGTQVVDYENRVIARDGSTRWLNWSACWDRDRNVIYAAARDVTERRRTEEVLRKNRDGMALAEQMAQMGTWIWEFGTEQAEWSDEVYRIFGLIPPPMGEPITYDRFIDLVHREDRSDVAVMMREVAESGCSFNMEYRLVRPDGAERTVQSRGTLQASSVDGASRMIGMVMDITERQRNEQEREHLLSELQMMVARIKRLQGMLPICASCKKIRNDNGYWEQIEVYIREHSEAEFSHGLCPDCAKRLYPDIDLDASQPTTAT